MRSLFGFLVAILVGFTMPVIPTSASGDEGDVSGKNSKIQLSGVGWVTYRYALAHEPEASVPGAPFPGGSDLQDHSSFDVDRVYLNGDYTLNDRYRFRATLEAENRSGDLELFLKRAYLEVKTPFNIENTSLRFGQLPHGMTGVVESTWGYRIVSKVPLDRYLGVSTTWVGAGVSGTPMNGIIDWDLVVANESSYNKSSSGRYKSFQGRVTVAPFTEGAAAGARLAVFGQYQAKQPPAGLPRDSGDNNDTYFEIFPHYQSERFTAGFEFAQRIDRHSIEVEEDLFGAEEITSQVIGGFARVMATDKIEIFGRLDFLDPNTDNDDDAATVLMGGLSHAYTKGLRSVIDLEYATYQEPEGVELDSDVTLSGRVEVSF